MNGYAIQDKEFQDGDLCSLAAAVGQKRLTVWALLLMMAFDRKDHQVAIVVCAMLGNFFISTTFAIIWLYTPELFPTNIR